MNMKIASLVEMKLVNFHFFCFWRQLMFGNKPTLNGYKNELVTFSKVRIFPNSARKIVFSCPKAKRKR